MPINKQQLLALFAKQQPLHHSAADDGLHAAAVLIPLIEANKRFSVLFTQRTDHLPTHPGQISFPGGRHHSDDKDLLTTALRETEEEIGINSKQVDIIGQLSCQPTISGFLICPFVGILQAPLHLTINKYEVADSFEVPLSHLLNQENYYQYQIQRQQQYFQVTAIDYQKHHIWGATAAIIYQLAQLLNEEHFPL